MQRLMSLIRTTAFAPLLFSMTTALIFFATPVFAGKVSLSGISQTSLMASCGKAGGQFLSSDDGFSCTTGKGSVSCTTSGKCTGECKTCGNAVTKSGKGSALGVLSGSTLKTSGSASSKPLPEPVKNTNAAGIKNTGGDFKKSDMSKANMGNSGDHHNKR